MKKQITVGILLLLLLLCLTGCAQESGLSETASEAVNADAKKHAEHALDKASDDVIFGQGYSEEDLTQKNTIPVIKVDILGYSNYDSKTAFFSKGKVGDVFYVVDADSKERVYQGEIESKRKGDFSAVTKDGSYYIEAAHIGRSCGFTIKKDRYGDMFDELFGRVSAYMNRKDSEFEEKVLIWNRLVQKKYSRMTAESEEIKALQETATALTKEADAYKSNTTAYIEELAVYSASMAMFSHMLKDFDEQKAADYLAEAEDTYIQVEAEKAMLLDEAYLFYPAAALYLATGKAPYESAAEDYLKENTERDFFRENISDQALTADEMYLFGVLAYLNTTFRVDVDICEALMQNLSTKAETFAAVSKFENHFCVADDYRNRLLADRLYVIAVVENVIVSPEYTNIVKNGIHYLGGCNETGGSYLVEYGVFDEVSDEQGSEAFLGSAYLDVLDKIK